MQDCKDGSGLQFIKFDFVTGGQEIRIVYFTVVCLVALPLSGSEAGGGLALIQTFLVFIC